MLPTTLRLLRVAFEADPTIPPTDRARLLALLRTGSALDTRVAPVADIGPRLLRRAEVARRLSCSLRTVDKLPVPKVRLPGRQRAAGYLESDIHALLARK